MYLSVRDWCLFFCPTVDTMHKLKFLKEQYAHLPAQGTDEWLKSRRTKVGGSEIAAVIGKCPYKKPAALIKQKKECTFIKSAACTFGRVMEDVAKHILAEDEGLDIHELGAIPSSRYPMCYSPDGVVVIGDDLKLIEIKCPFRRSKLDNVPDHYNCQIQAGMNILPCEEALFIQFRIRICTIRQLGHGKKYNRWVHVESYKRCPDKEPTHWGFLHFRSRRPLTDLGALGKDNILSLCKIDRMSFTIHMGSVDFPMNGFVIPFKVFGYTIINVPRDPTFLAKNQDALWNAHKALAETDAETDTEPTE